MSTSNERAEEQDRSAGTAQEPQTIHRIRRWIERAGFALELRVARAFAQHAADTVTASRFYLAPGNPPKWREIDVVATRSEQRGALRVRLTAIAECKSGKHKPWVVLTDKSGYMGDTEAFGRLLTQGDRLDDAKAVIRAIRGLPILPTGYPGHSIVEALRGTKPKRKRPASDGAEDNVNPDDADDEPLEDDDGPSVPYRAVQQVASAAVNWPDDGWSGPVDDTRAFEIILPIVVTASPLFECFLDDTGEIQVEPRASVLLDVQAEDRADPLFVQVMTEAYLREEWAPGFGSATSWIDRAEP